MRPPKVISPGACADVFGDWLAAAPSVPGRGLFGPHRKVYRAIWRRILALAPEGWRPHAFRRGAAHVLQRDPDLSPEDLRDLLDHKDFKTTQLYLADSTAPGRRRLAKGDLCATKLFWTGLIASHAASPSHSGPTPWETVRSVSGIRDCRSRCVPGPLRSAAVPKVCRRACD